MLSAPLAEAAGSPAVALFAAAASGENPPRAFMRFWPGRCCAQTACHVKEITGTWFSSFRFWRVAEVVKL